MKEKRLTINMVLNVVRGILCVLFPLITFPYISKILGVNNIGQYNFAKSIVNYFILFAGLGINTYAVREGARIRDNKDNFQAFVNEVYSINVISTLASYALMTLLIFFVPKIHSYKSLVLILSVQIVFKTIGVDWIYSIFEDYFYITIRSILVQLISLLLMFIFVKDENDLFLYVIIVVFSNSGANLFNYLHSKKYCKIKFIWSMRFLKHIRPILVLFSTSLAVSVYVNSDITILGFLCSDYVVGIYSVSTKVYEIIKLIPSSMLIVTIPRVSSMLQSALTNEVSELLSQIMNILLTVLMPIIVGLYLIKDKVILLVSDRSYLPSSYSLGILCLALLFCILAGFYSQCVLIPYKQEKVVLLATICSAVLNIILNLIFIPIYEELAAACTTVVAEFFSFAWCAIVGRKFVKLHGIWKNVISVLTGCVLIVCLSRFLTLFHFENTAYIIVMITLSALLYLIVEILLKNTVVCEAVGTLKRKLFYE